MLNHYGRGSAEEYDWFAAGESGEARADAFPAPPEQPLRPGLSLAELARHGVDQRPVPKDKGLEALRTERRSRGTVYCAGCGRPQGGRSPNARCRRCRADADTALARVAAPAWVASPPTPDAAPASDETFAAALLAELASDALWGAAS